MGHVCADFHRPSARARVLVWCTALGWLVALFSGAAEAQGVAEPPVATATGIACPPPLPPVPARLVAVDRGFLWRLQRDGRTSWLYGTLHVGRPSWARLGPRVQAALRQSDVLALEIDVPGETQALAAQQRAAPPGDPLAAWPDALRGRAAQALQRACIDPQVLAPLAPLAQLLTWTLLDARWDGLDALFGQEALLLRAAQQRQPKPLPLVGLETLAQQLAALAPPAASGTAAGAAAEAEAAAARTLEQALDALDSGRERRTLLRLAEVWARGDWAALVEAAQVAEAPPTPEEAALHQRLNDGRNPGLAAAIEARHARGERVFAAIGALHMTGPQAVTRLLAARGFCVERVPLRTPAR